jgi:hypothetical protein
MTTYTISASNSPGRQSGDVLWTDDVDASFYEKTNTTYQFRPGTYVLREYIYPKTGSVFKGLNAIAIPTNQAQYVTPDPTRMAVFETANPNATERVKNNSVTGGIVVKNASSVTLQDLFLLGFTGIELRATTSSTVERCIVQHYMGTYPNGKWCWHQRTGAFWQYVGCSGNAFTSCISQYANHHGFLNHDDPKYQDYIRNTTYTDCRALMAGCGKEKDASGYEDWSCAFDIAESVNVDGVTLRRCYAEGGWKCNFYYEPETTGTYDAHGGPYVRRNILLEDCVAVDGGRSGGGFRGTMVIREGENANFYIDSGTMRRCKSYNGSKAGFYARSEPESTGSSGPIYEDCLDCGSNIGYLLEVGGADAVYRNCISANAVKWAWKVMGDEVTIENARVKVKTGQTNPPFYIGGYTRVYLQDSRHTAHTTLVASTTAQTYWPAKNLTISACVQNLPTGVAAYMIHPGTSSQSVAGVAIRSGCVSEIASTICERSSGTTTPDPDDPVVVPDDPVVVFDGVLFKNARITPSAGPYGTRFTLVIEPHRSA